MPLFKTTKPELLKPAMTTVIIRLKSGHERMYRYPGIQRGFDLDVKLDALMDEMDDGAIKSPIQIVREHADGRVKTENIRIYSPDE